MTKEKAGWPKVDLGNFKRTAEDMAVGLDACMDQMLELDSSQTELIGQFEEIQAFGERLLRSSSNPPRSALEKDVDVFCKFCQQGNVEAALELVMARGPAKARQRSFLLLHDETGATGMHLAARGGHAELVAALLKFGFPLDHADQHHGLSVSFWAVSNPTIDSRGVLAILNKENALRGGKSVVLYAIRFGNLTAVQFLLESCGFGVNFKEERTGRSALHMAAFRGYMGISSLLLANGANHLALNKAGETPLYEAFLGKRSSVVMLFARRGFFLSASDTVKLRELFANDQGGKELLKLPHQDALRRIRNLSEV